MPKILLVEDNEMNRDMLSRRLLKRGYDVAVAPDAETAFNKITEDRPDLILMDISLPGMSGWDATERLKGSPLTQAIPVIALTAHAMSQDRQKAFEVGCADYETKPVELPALLAKIARCLGQGR